MRIVERVERSARLVRYAPQGSVSFPVCRGSTECTGLCVNLDTDRDHCGACEAACEQGQVCSEGTCSISCQVGLSECAGTCVNTQTDNQHCGDCGVVCEAGTVCVEGSCSLSCQQGLTNCEGACVDTTSDNRHCGTCNHECEAGQVCSNGTCVLTCASGTVDCGTCVDPLTNPDYCGASGDCQGTNAGEDCTDTEGVRQRHLHPTRPLLPATHRNRRHHAWHHADRG